MIIWTVAGLVCGACGSGISVRVQLFAVGGVLTPGPLGPPQLEWAQESARHHHGPFLYRPVWMLSQRPIFPSVN